jgi:ATP-binding cassette subfamily B protein
MSTTPQPSSLRVAWRQITSILSPWRKSLALIAATVLVGALAELVPPLVMKQVIDEHLAHGRADGLPLLAGLYLGAVAAVQGLSFFTNYLTALTAQGALHALRTRLFAHLQRLPLSYYDQTPLGDIISRCTADVDTVDTLFSSGVASLLADMIRLVTVSAAMVLLNPPLALVSALVVPPLVLVTDYFRVRVRDAERANRRAVGLLNTHLQETLGGVEVIRAFGREPSFVARFGAALRQALDAYNLAARYSALYAPLMAMLAALATALLLWAGTRQMFSAWNISLGTLTAFVLLFRRFFQPITALGDEWQTVQSALSGLERILQVLALPVEWPPAARQRTPTDDAAPIELRDVTFGYLAERPVLRRVSLTARMGEHVAIVGQTGAGKSSLVSLLGGLYAPWDGQVRAAGCDPRQLAEGERRGLIGVVPQMTQLFSGTVLENLTLGDASVSRDAVERAAALTGADDFIRALPRGYDTWLGVGAAGNGASAQFSAGQRQLLALTRALVWQPPVLLLDEATAAIDSASEAALREALRVSGRNRAVLTVAHRLSTARKADRVIVMDAGRILEEGTPAELVQRGGRFAALLELEAAGWDWRNISAE